MMSNSPLPDATKRLRQLGIEAAAREARILLGAVLDTAPERLLAMDISLSTAQAEHYEQLLQRRISREPISQIIGHQPFWSLDFYVNRHSLTPRADSETLIEATLASIPDANAPLRILDLGTGSGCLLLTLLHEWPHATGIGVDASEQALAVALHNATELRLADRAALQQGNWAEQIDETFDVVISNPPYIEHGDMADLMPEVRQFEPHSALDGGPDGLNDYRTILADMPRLLNPAGFAVLELGIGQQTAVQQIGEQSGLRHLHTNADLAGIPRAIMFTHSSTHA